MGVPLNANRQEARNSLTARVWRAPGFLIAWASSRMARFHSKAFNQASRETIE
jgi:hypothetical protein